MTQPVNQYTPQPTPPRKKLDPITFMLIMAVVIGVLVVAGLAITFFTSNNPTTINSNTFPTTKTGTTPLPPLACFSYQEYSSSSFDVSKEGREGCVEGPIAAIEGADQKGNYGINFTRNAKKALVQIVIPKEALPQFDTAQLDKVKSKTVRAYGVLHQEGTELRVIVRLPGNIQVIS
jgi:flagellar basal body-associated protein FliL